MSATDCAACGKRVHVDAAVCPHCGARRARGSLAAAKPSKDELLALLATDPTHSAARPRGVIATMLLPHPGTAGLARAVELALTVVALPLVLAGIVGIALVRLSFRSPVFALTGEAVPALLMTIFGGLALWGVAPLPLVGASIAAVWLRALVRRSTR
jgi:hypothetical protein